jgi:hypothetical protein
LLLISPELISAAPEAAAVQGLYEGTFKDAKVEARVVAQGDGHYKLLLRFESGLGKTDCVKWVMSKTEGDLIRFYGKLGGVDWHGVYTAGAILMSSSHDNSWKLTRVERKSPTLGKQPPQGAFVYLDGKSLANLRHTQGGKKPATDTSYEPDGSYKIPANGIDSATYGPDFEYDAHIEFNFALVPNAHGWSRANSGWLFLPNNSKITLLDSFGEPCPFSQLPPKEREKRLKANPSAETSFKGLVSGGIYDHRNPEKMEKIDSLKGDSDDNLYPLAVLPPLEWQTLDLEYRLPTDGKPRLTAYMNGVKIHDNVELDRNRQKGVFHFRPSQVLWRNFWAIPASKK